MQLKTIRKIISTKIEEWLNSITNEELKKALKKDIIVSGGCITSLLNSEVVNDYDVYIKTYKTLKNVIEYYTIGNKIITVLEGNYKSSYVINEDTDNAYASSIRNLKDNQIKLFFNGNPGHKTGVENKNEDYSYKPMFFSPNAISLAGDIQIVIRFWGDSKEIHKNYDFIHATNYWTFENGLVTNKEALESIITKQLIYQGSVYPVTSILRTKKFLKRGWGITAGETLKIIFQCSLLDLTNYDVLEEQLIGVDVAYFSKLIEILRNVGTNKVDKLDYHYLATLIDKVFNDTDDDLKE